MHEIAIAEKVIREAEAQGAQIAIKIEVGELAEITAEELEEALVQMTDMKPIIEKVQSRIKCKCGYEGKAQILDRGHGYCIFKCPECDNKPEVIAGGEIRITGVE